MASSIVPLICRNCGSDYRVPRHHKSHVIGRLCIRCARKLPPDVRFWFFVTKGQPDECWEWQGSRKTGHEYGHFTVHSKMRLAHRMSWVFTHGEIPLGLDILHRCDNPPCVNPAHLFAGTHETNMKDMLEKGRANKARGNRHPNAKLTPALVRQIRTLLAQGIDRQTVATQFRMSKTGIRLIDRRVNWAWVE